MKGPYERLKYDLRRLWECPQCRRRERSDGTVTFRHCLCMSSTGGHPIPMTLLEEAGHRTVPPIAPPQVSPQEAPPGEPDSAALPPAELQPAAAPPPPEDAP